jgi:hypothetical protein
MNRTLRPFFSFFGGKWTLAAKYPPPKYGTIIEPFAGSAGYSTRYSNRDVILVEREPVVAALWRWLIGVSVDEVMGLPLDPEKRHTLHPAAKSLIGFWCARGRTQPANTTTSGWLLSGKWPSSFWGPYARQRIADQVQRIRHWRLIEGDYSMAPDVEGTWFVDPPYHGSLHYRARVRSYEHLSTWVRNRSGQIIACEQKGATWLPFVGFQDAKSIDRKVKTEVVWLRSNDSPPVPETSASELYPE